MHRIRLSVAVLLCAAWCGVLVPGARAQAVAGAREGEVASDPIRCWWKADRTAVRVGEPFALVLTCAVIEAGPIVVVPALNQLEPGALSITPFEVIRGQRGDDVVAPPWRYVQFEYAVRLLNDGFFGQEVAVPGLTVTYNLQTAGGTQGRDQSYELPTLPMRILSLVPAAASDIRDASGQTFEAIGARRFRASLAFVAAAIVLAFAAVLLVFAVLQAVRQYRVTHAVAARLLPVSAVLGACLATLTDVADTAARGGWSPELARQAISALRVAAAVGLGRPVAQEPAAEDAARHVGQITVRSGWLRRTHVVVSAPVTQGAIARHLDRDRRMANRQRAALTSLAEALGALTAVSYGREWRAENADLDAAVRSGQEAIRRLRVRLRWPMRAPGAATQSLAGLP